MHGSRNASFELVAPVEILAGEVRFVNRTRRRGTQIGSMGENIKPKQGDEARL